MVMEPVKQTEPLTFHTSDSMSELPQRRTLIQDDGKASVGSLKSSLRRKRTQKLLTKDTQAKKVIGLKDLMAQDEYSSISSFVDKNGDAMTQQPMRVRKKLFDNDTLSVCSKMSSKSRRSLR